ncbi:MAG: plasmid mobilization relaxosome protein MobC [Micavibrio sp.]|nr:MAG: plasmid mobilization relaxosome protein MobC [Micavibrio sp.]
MKTSQKQNHPTFSLRLSPEERQELEMRAGRMPVGAYIRFILFEMPSPRRKTRKTNPDQNVLRELLTELANTRLANNLNQIARACNRGQMQVTEETEAALKQAYKDIHDIRLQLLQALGLKAQAEAEKQPQKGAEDIEPTKGTP